MIQPNPFLNLKDSSLWKKNDTPIWIASSFSLQRNLASSPFPHKMDRGSSERILGTLKQSLLNSSNLDHPQFLMFDAMKVEEKEFLFEHFFANYRTRCSECQSGIVIDKSGTFLAMINQEDHLLLHSIETHSGWQEAWKKLTVVAEDLAKIHSFAYSNKFGYLTAQPGSAGTALTVQVFLHLPCLIELDQIDEVLIKELDENVQANGLSGTYDFIGDIVVIENRFTLGIKEERLVEVVHQTAMHLVAHEKKLRTLLRETPDPLIIDRISRSIGLLKYSYQIDTKGAFSAVSLIKLGIDLGWVEGLTDKEVNNIFFEIRRGHLSLTVEGEISQEKLAQKRAEFLKLALKPITMNVKQ